MNRKIFALVESSRFIMCNEKNEIKTFEISASKEIPNIPMYHHIWGNEQQYFKMLRETFNSLNVPRLLKPDVYFLMPDDIVELDKRCIKEFFLAGGARNITIGTLGQFLSIENGTHATIIRSERNMILQYRKSYELIAEKYLDRTQSDVDFIRSEIYRLHDDLQAERLKIFIFGDLVQSNYLGEIVSVEQIIQNLRAYAAKKKYHLRNRLSDNPIMAYRISRKPSAAQNTVYSWVQSYCAYRTIPIQNPLLSKKSPPFLSYLLETAGLCSYYGFYQLIARPDFQAGRQKPFAIKYGLSVVFMRIPALPVAPCASVAVAVNGMDNGFKCANNFCKKIHVAILLLILFLRNIYLIHLALIVRLDCEIGA